MMKSMSPCLAFVVLCVTLPVSSRSGTLLAQLAPKAAETQEAGAANRVTFSFAVVADPHCAEKPRWELHKYDKRCGNHVERFLKCVSETEALKAEDKPDFILVVGDIHLWELRKHMDRVTIPLHVIAGNHESGARKQEMRELFPQDFQVNGKASDYYSFVHKGCRFIGVCTSGRGGDHVGHLCSEEIRPEGQCEWLERELAQPEARKFIFSHIPPHPEGTDRNSYMSRNDSRFFNALVAKTRPDAMFFGHQHQPTREFLIGRTRTFVLRSSAWNSRGAPLGFLLVRVTPEGLETREILTSVYAEELTQP